MPFEKGGNNQTHNQEQTIKSSSNQLE